MIGIKKLFQDKSIQLNNDVFQDNQVRVICQNEIKYTPKVSVIIPVFDVGEYLRQSLDSVANQTLKEIEIICIDDESTDNSLEILKEYASKDNRITILSEQNQGQGVARNNGIEISKGEYIQFIDPDDWIELDMLEKLYSFAKEKKSEIVRFNFYDYNDYSGKLKKFDFVKIINQEYGYDLIQKPYFSWRDLKNDFLTKLNMESCIYFCKADFIKNKNIRFAPGKYCEDHLFTGGAILLANRVDYLNEYFYYYRKRVGSSIDKPSNDKFCVFENIKLLKQFIIDNLLYEELKDEIEKYAKEVLIWHYNLIPEESKEKFEELSLKYFTSLKEFKEFVKSKKKKNSFLENIFSLKNQKKGAIEYKAFTVLGLTVLIKPKQRKASVPKIRKQSKASKINLVYKIKDIISNISYQGDTE